MSEVVGEEGRGEKVGMGSRVKGRGEREDDVRMAAPCPFFPLIVCPCLHPPYDAFWIAESDFHEFVGKSSLWVGVGAEL